MKQLSFLFLAFVFVGGSIAQTSFESPHVKDGKTIQFTLPEGFFFVEGSDVAGDAMFVKKEGVNYTDIDPSELGTGLLMILHEPADDTSQLQDYIGELEASILEENEGLLVIEKPKIVKLGGRDVLHGGFKGKVGDDNVDGLYFSATRFGDYYIFVSYFAVEGVTDLISYDEYIKIIGSWKVVDTDKADGLETFKEEEYSSYTDEEVYEDYAKYFRNDLFETKINYNDILPDFEAVWDEVKDESGHLLSMYGYKEDGGFIKVFSGGLASNYSSEQEMASALQLAMDWTKPMTLEFNTRFSNEDHLFKLYTISGGGSMSSVYTTEVNEELVFFVVDAGSNPVDDFKPAVRDFMLTMWVDYFDE